MTRINDPGPKPRSANARIISRTQGKPLPIDDDEPRYGVWQDISTAPKDGTYIDVFAFVLWENEPCRVTDVRWRKPNKKWDEYGSRVREEAWRLDDGETVTPTHWMPQPPPPKATRFDQKERYEHDRPDGKDGA